MCALRKGFAASGSNLAHQACRNAETCSNREGANAAERRTDVCAETDMFDREANTIQKEHGMAIFCIAARIGAAMPRACCDRSSSISGSSPKSTNRVKEVHLSSSCVYRFSAHHSCRRGNRETQCVECNFIRRARKSCQYRSPLVPWKGSAKPSSTSSADTPPSRERSWPVPSTA
jgi:hypothetical protein